MANFMPNKINLNSINGGRRYGFEAVSPEAINAPIEASAYAQALATNQPDISEISGEGLPSVTIEETENGTPRLSFKNLKGAKGDSGLSYGASLSNELGNSDINGYTQAVINGLVAKSNILINGDFRINQRKENSYTGGYSVDRWYAQNSCRVSPTNNGLLMTHLGNAEGRIGICQSIDNYGFLLGKTVTMSTKINNPSVGYGASIKIGIISADNIADTIGGAEFASKSIPLDEDFESKILSFTVTLPDTTPYSHLICYVAFENGSGGDEIDVEWVKLEMSNYPTEYIYEPYEIELLKCQRYYKRIDIFSESSNRLASFAMGYVSTSDLAYVILPGIKLRRIPTIIYSGNFVLNTSDGNKSITGISISETLSDNLVLQINGSRLTTYSYMLPCSLSSRDDERAFIAFDAELY